MTPIFYLARVYSSGHAKHSVRDEAGKENWLKYNRKFRPGCALFVDGISLAPSDHGSLTADQINLIERAIQNELSAGQIDLTKIDVISPQVEDAGRPYEHRYVGYRPEASRSSFSINPIVDCQL